MPLTAVAVSAGQCQHGPYQQFLLQHAVASIAEPVGVATGLLPHTSGRQVMTSIDTTSSQVSDSEISATLVSLRERFEAVRRDVMQRVRGRLGNLSADQENAIDSLSHGIIEKVLEAPMT